MKIVTENSDLMVIKSGNLFGYTIGGVFILLGLVILLQPKDFVINTDIPWWVALFIIILGSFSIVLPTIDYITFDKRANKLGIRQKNIFLSRSNNYKLSQIKEMEMRSVPNGGRQGGYSQRLLCVLKSGEQIILPTKSSTLMLRAGAVSFNLSSVESVGRKIANFLNIPFIDKGIPTLVETITEAVNTILASLKKKISDHQNSEEGILPPVSPKE